MILYCEDLSGKCNDFVSDSTHITLTTYFNSPELTRLLNQISDSPEMSGVLFRTLVNIMYDPQKVRAFNLNENPCSFKLLSLEDLLEKASPISDPDERFWENFHLKDEAPQIKQKNSE